jgi:hypothetical protein
MLLVSVSDICFHAYEWQRTEPRISLTHKNQRHMETRVFPAFLFFGLPFYENYFS